MVVLKGTLINDANGALNEVNDNLTSSDKCLGSQATYGAMALISGGGKNYTGYVVVSVTATPKVYAYYYNYGSTSASATVGYAVYGQVWWISTTSA